MIERLARDLRTAFPEMKGLPTELQISLPSIEQIEHELTGDSTSMENDSQ